MKKLTQFYISPETLTSYFDAAINKCKGVKGLYSVYGCFHATIQCLWLSENGFGDLMLSFEYNRTSNIFVDVNIKVKNHNFTFPLILDKYNIMIVCKN